MLETIVDWLIWLSTSVPEVWMPRQSPLFELARAIWTMFILLGLMYLLSTLFRRFFFSHSLDAKGRNTPPDHKSRGRDENNS